MVAFEVIGSELKLTVLHSLLSGPKRFNELRVATGMCQSSLAKTLKELERSDRGAEGPSGPAGRGRVPPVAERRGALRGGPDLSGGRPAGS